MPRRGNREGSFWQEPPRGRRKYPRWIGRVEIAGSGRLEVIGRKGETKASVRERLHALRDQQAGVSRPAGSLGDWLELWLRLYCRDLASRTLASYGDVLGRWVLPVLGSRPMAKVTPDELLLALERIPRPATRRYAYAVLRIALGRAVKTGRVRQNVCTLIDPPKVRRRVVEPPSAAQVAVVLDVLRGERDEALILTAVSTGLRQGELVGLRWMDVEVDGDWVAGTPGGPSAMQGGDGSRVDALVRGGGGAGRPVSVWRNDERHGRGRGHLHVRGQLGRDRKYVGAKRGSERTVPVPPRVVAALEAHRHRVTLATGRHPDDGAYIFTDAHGQPMTGFEARRRWMVAWKAAGLPLPAPPFHGLRHRYNTALIEAGMPPEMVRAVVGHRNAAMTGHYTHATDEARRRAAEIMERVVG